MIRAFIFLAIALGPSTASAAQWHLVMLEKSELYSAVLAYRLETSLVQLISSDQIAVWVRTDYLRSKNFKYPKSPRHVDGKLIRTESYLWEKQRFLVNCRTQQVHISDGSYLLAEENVELDNHNMHVTHVVPDSVYEVVFKLSCVNQQPRASSDIQRVAQKIEQILLPDKNEQERIRQERNIPRVKI